MSVREKNETQVNIDTLDEQKVKRDVSVSMLKHRQVDDDRGRRWV